MVKRSHCLVVFAMISACALPKSSVDQAMDCRGAKRIGEKYHVAMIAEAKPIGDIYSTQPMRCAGILLNFRSDSAFDQMLKLQRIAESRPNQIVRFKANMTGLARHSKEKNITIFDIEKIEYVRLL